MSRKCLQCCGPQTAQVRRPRAPFGSSYTRCVVEMEFCRDSRNSLLSSTGVFLGSDRRDLWDVVVLSSAVLAFDLVPQVEEKGDEHDWQCEQKHGHKQHLLKTTMFPPMVLVSYTCRRICGRARATPCGGSSRSTRSPSSCATGERKRRRTVKAALMHRVHSHLSPTRRRLSPMSSLRGTPIGQGHGHGDAPFPTACPEAYPAWQVETSAPTPSILEER